MFVKRVLHSLRNWLVSASQLVIPLVFTLLTLIIIKTLPSPGDSPPLTLTLNKFGYNVVAYSTGINESQSKTADTLAHLYAQQFNGTLSSMVYLNKLTKYANNPLVMRYLQEEGVRSLSTYNNDYQAAATFNGSAPDGQALDATAAWVTGYFNDEAYHTPAMSLSTVDNAVLRNVANSNYTIWTVNHPLPRTTREQINDLETRSFDGFIIALNVVFSMAFLAGSFVVFLIKERDIRSKHCQFVSGVGSFTFWGSTFAWDFINYILPIVSLIIAFWAFGIEAYYVNGHWAYILLMFTLFGCSMLPFMYNASFLFRTPATGYVWITMFNVLSGQFIKPINLSSYLFLEAIKFLQ